MHLAPSLGSTTDRRQLFWLPTQALRGFIVKYSIIPSSHHVVFLNFDIPPGLGPMTDSRPIFWQPKAPCPCPCHCPCRRKRRPPCFQDKARAARRGFTEPRGPYCEFLQRPAKKTHSKCSGQLYAHSAPPHGTNFCQKVAPKSSAAWRPAIYTKVVYSIRRLPGGRPWRWQLRPSNTVQFISGLNLRSTKNGRIQVW